MIILKYFNQITAAILVFFHLYLRWRVTKMAALIWLTCLSKNILLFYNNWEHIYLFFKCFLYTTCIKVHIYFTYIYIYIYIHIIVCTALSPKGVGPPTNFSKGNGGLDRISFFRNFFFLIGIHSMQGWTATTLTKKQAKI